MTKEEAYRQYEETLALIAKQSHEAMEKARATLGEQLKAIRSIEQKTKRGRRR